MVRCREVMDAVERIAPKSLAEEWDNPGLLVGSPAQEIHRILLCLDVDDTAIAKAIDLGADMILSHHPLIFRPLKNLRTDLPLGRRIRTLLKHDIAVYAAHTNLDAARGGVNDVLAERLGLSDLEPLVAKEDGEGMGRIGRLSMPMSIEDFARRVKDALPVSHVRLVAAGERMVQRVALCSGSGAEFIPKAAAMGADAFVTGDVRYHDAQHGAERGMHVIDAGHFGTEFPVVAAWRERLEKELGGSVELLVEDGAKDVFAVV